MLTGHVRLCDRWLASSPYIITTTTIIIIIIRLVGWLVGNRVTMAKMLTRPKMVQMGGE